MPYPETTVIICPDCKQDFLVLNEAKDCRCPYCERVLTVVVEQYNEPDPRHIC